MSSKSGNGDEEQAIEIAEATDADTIRERLPEDIRERLTKKAFSPGTLRKILRDTYFIGPIGIGRGGWRGIYGNGKPGTEMRRPGGALYNFPRSWRFSALERGLETGVITHVGDGRFAATERGVAVLRLIDECPDCGEVRVPGVSSTYYVGNPNTEGHLESHRMVTFCPDCGNDGYGFDIGSSATSISEFERDDEYVERAVEAIADHPEARTFGGERPVSENAAGEVPDVDEDAIAEVLDEYVEAYTEPSARSTFDPVDEDLYGRPVITIPGDGDVYRFKGTPESVAVSRNSHEGDIHLTTEDDGRLKVGMSYEIAVEYNVKDSLGYHEGAKWTGNYWTVDADQLARVVSKLTIGYSDEGRRGRVYFPDSDEDPKGDEQWYTVTVSADAMAACSNPMLGVDENGELV